MDHSKHTRLATAELTPANLEGATHVVVVGGGFVWIGAKRVAVPLQQLEFMRDDSGHVHAVTNWTKDQLKDMPEHHH